MNEDDISPAEARFLEAKAATERHAAAHPTTYAPPTPRRGLSAIHWLGIVVALGLVALAITGGSETDRARKAATGAGLDALATCQARIAARTGQRAIEVPYTPARAVEGGYQFLWRGTGTRCEVRGGRVVELVIAGQQE